MKKILLLSDTHSHWDERLEYYAKGADELWHAGDFGSKVVVEKLQAIAPLRGVYGNIDGAELRAEFPEYLDFTLEGVRVLMLHIGGYPTRYSPRAKELLKNGPFSLFISGHSHILKVMHDRDLNLLHLNPGAAGKSGWHKVRTLLSFSMDEGDIKDLQVIELPKHTGL